MNLDELKKKLNAITLPWFSSSLFKDEESQNLANREIKKVETDLRELKEAFDEFEKEIKAKIDLNEKLIENLEFYLDTVRGEV